MSVTQWTTWLNLFNRDMRRLTLTLVSENIYYQFYKNELNRFGIVCFCPLSLISRVRQSDQRCPLVWNFRANGKVGWKSSNYRWPQSLKDNWIMSKTLLPWSKSRGRRICRKYCADWKCNWSDYNKLIFDPSKFVDFLSISKNWLPWRSQEILWLWWNYIKFIYFIQH